MRRHRWLERLRAPENEWLLGIVVAGAFVITTLVIIAILRGYQLIN